MIASARMYEWAPSLVTAWRQLLQGVTARAGVALDFVDSRAVSLDELWAREDLGCVFMCGYPYALRADRPALLAAPVPSPARFGGKAVYVTDFIVRADGPPPAACGHLWGRHRLLDRALALRLQRGPLPPAPVPIRPAAGAVHPSERPICPAAPGHPGRAGRGGRRGGDRRLCTRPAPAPRSGGGGAVARGGHHGAGA